MDEGWNDRRDEGRGDRRHFLAIAAVVAVALVVIGGALASTFVLNLGGNLTLRIGADAAVSADPSNGTGDPGTVTATWTAKPSGSDAGPLGDDEPRPADYLTVHWAATDGDPQVEAVDYGHVERNVTVTNGTWRLAAVGHAVTLTERNASTATTVRLLVTAVWNDQKTVIVARTVTL